MLKLSQLIERSALDCRMSVILPACVMLPEPETTWPPVGWLVVLTALVPHKGATHGAVGGEACARGDSASEIAAARTLRFEVARPDLPLPLAVSDIGIQAFRISLQMRR